MLKQEQNVNAASLGGLSPSGHEPGIRQQLARAKDASANNGDAEVYERNGHQANGTSIGAAKSINRSYFDDYHNGRSYKDEFKRYFDAKYVQELIKTVWGSKPPYRLLDAGSASGLTLAEFAKRRIDAWGVERNKYIHQQTPHHLNRRNLLGDIRKLDFADNYFDFVYETCLAYLPEGQLGRAIRELRRVTKRGIIFGSITTDMNAELFKRRNLLFGMKSLMTLREWSELFGGNGFTVATTDPGTLASVWGCEKKYNAGDDDWYPDEISLRYCFYTKVR
jgi:SAM-dependent methyltransferase